MLCNDKNRKIYQKAASSEPDETIENIMETNIISVHTLDDQEDIANIFRKYDWAIPVVGTDWYHNHR